MSKEIEERDAQWMELVKAMNDYITLLGQELDDSFVFLSVHGYKSKRVQQGIDVRNKILEIQNKIKGND